MSSYAVSLPFPCQSPLPFPPLLTSGREVSDSNVAAPAGGLGVVVAAAGDTVSAGWSDLVFAVSGSPPPPLLPPPGAAACEVIAAGGAGWATVPGARSPAALARWASGGPTSPPASPFSSSRARFELGTVISNLTARSRAIESAMEFTRQVCVFVCVCVCVYVCMRVLCV